MPYRQRKATVVPAQVQPGHAIRGTLHAIADAGTLGWGLTPNLYVIQPSTQGASMSDPKGKIQGEGDKEADRNYRKRTTEFLKSKKGQQAVEHAGDLSEEEARKLKKYEEQGKARAKGEDPQIKHQSNK
jgi:hypothetical protein